jgi:HSP20 family protein
MLVKYSPFDEFTTLSRFFNEAFSPMLSEGSAARPWTPAVDIRETENELIFTADVPDVKPENIEVNFENGTLTLRGKREFEKKEETKGYHRIERSYGSFTRAFTVPETVDPETLAADYKNGVLTVTIGKKEVAKPRTVKVNVQAA